MQSTFANFGNSCVHRTRTVIVLYFTAFKWVLHGLALYCKHCIALHMYDIKIYSYIYGKHQDDFCCLHGIHGRSSSAYKSMHSAKQPQHEENGKKHAARKKTYLFDDITCDAFDCAPCRLRTRFSALLFLLSFDCWRFVSALILFYFFSCRLDSDSWWIEWVLRLSELRWRENSIRYETIELSTAPLVWSVVPLKRIGWLLLTCHASRQMERNGMAWGHGMVWTLMKSIDRRMNETICINSINSGMSIATKLHRA